MIETTIAIQLSEKHYLAFLKKKESISYIFIDFKNRTPMAG